MDPQEMLEKTRGLAPRERAAAIAHWVYTATARALPEWQSRVPEDWENLPESARQFNLASVDTWARLEEVTRAWIDAIQACREHEERVRS